MNKRLKIIIILLVIFLLGSIVTNIVLSKKLSGANLVFSLQRAAALQKEKQAKEVVQTSLENNEMLVDTSEEQLEFKFDDTDGQFAEFGNTKWEWRYTGNKENYDGNYTLSYTDENNQKTDLYSSQQDELFGDFYWKFYNKGNAVVITDIAGAPEGAGYTHISFKNDTEVYRVYYSTYRSYVQNFTFQAKNSPKYSIKLYTSGLCQNNEKETELLGVILTSSDDGQEKTFFLDSPTYVPCVNIDGTNSEPTILSDEIYPSSSGISFLLPNRQNVYIYVDDTIDDVQLVF